MPQTATAAGYGPRRPVQNGQSLACETVPVVPGRRARPCGARRNPREHRLFGGIRRRTAMFLYATLPPRSKTPGRLSRLARLARRRDGPRHRGSARRACPPQPVQYARKRRPRQPCLPHGPAARRMGESSASETAQPQEADTNSRDRAAQPNEQDPAPYFSPAMKRRNWASSIRQSSPKIDRKSDVRSAGVYSVKGGRAAVRARYRAYFAG
jgi:hypothetical protein